MKRVDSDTIANVLVALSAGLTITAAARQHGVSHTTVLRYVRKFGVPYRSRTRGHRITSAQWNAGVALVRGGMTRAAAAKAIGVSQAHLSRHCARVGLTAEVQHAAEAVRADAVAAVAAGASITATAKRFGYSLATVQAWCRQAGVKTTWQGFDVAPPSAPPETRIRALALVQAGESYNATARAVGVGGSTVRKWAMAAGVRSAHRATAQRAA